MQLKMFETRLPLSSDVPAHLIRIVGDGGSAGAFSAIFVFYKQATRSQIIANIYRERLKAFELFKLLTPNNLPAPEEPPDYRKNTKKSGLHRSLQY